MFYFKILSCWISIRESHRVIFIAYATLLFRSLSVPFYYCFAFCYYHCICTALFCVNWLPKLVSKYLHSSTSDSRRNIYISNFIIKFEIFDPKRLVTSVGYLLYMAGTSCMSGEISNQVIYGGLHIPAAIIK